MPPHSGCFPEHFSVSAPKVSDEKKHEQMEKIPIKKSKKAPSKKATEKTPL